MILVCVPSNKRWSTDALMLSQVLASELFSTSSPTQTPTPGVIPILQNKKENKVSDRIRISSKTVITVAKKEKPKSRQYDF